MLLPLFFIKAADPAGPRIVFAVSAECVVNLINKLQSQTLEFFAPGLLMKAEKVADRKCVRP
jgi:hypothetical protein